MANLPAEIPQRTRADKIRELIVKGYSLEDIAKGLAKKNKRKQRAVLAQLHRIMATDREMQELRALETRGQHIEQLPRIGTSLARKARAGRVDAAKLIMETTGYHNPKVSHEHSGDIKVTLHVVPRPPIVEDITEADVVEE